MLLALSIYAAGSLGVLALLSFAREFRKRPRAFAAPILLWPFLPFVAAGLAALVLYGTLIERRDLARQRSGGPTAQPRPEP